MNEIFCSYAHEDLKLFQQFHDHLSLMKRQGLISSWYDGMIKAGQSWNLEIEQHLASANIILLFVSAAFLSSTFCMEQEVPRALERSRTKEAVVIPIILRPCDWQTAPFAHLQALPDLGKPVSTWTDQDTAFTNIVQAIRQQVTAGTVPPMKRSLLNLPFHPNRLFTGRGEVLQALHDSLQRARETVLVQAITGLGGIGKTQTTVAYAYRYQNEYSRIIWLHTQSQVTLVSDIIRLARELNTPACYDQDQSLVIQGFLNWLAHQSNWLLIFDNVEDLSLVRTYTPASRQGHLLLTTRQHALGGSIERVEIDTMSPDVGGYFLLKRAKRIALDTPPEDIPPEEMAVAQQISEMLGGLPLALDQAGGYIERKGCSLSRYIQIYNQAHTRLLAERGFPEDTRDYPETVATTWSLAFQSVAQDKDCGSIATDLLHFCAFLAPDDIPVEIFEHCANLLGPHFSSVASQSFLLEDAIELLLHYSLIRREDEVLSIHRLVQTVLRDALSPEEWRLWAERAIQVLNAIFPDPQRVEDWPLCQYLLPHMLACASWIMQTDIKSEDAALILSWSGYYTHTRLGQYTEAERLYKQAFQIYQQVLGEQHHNTAHSLNNLAELYHAQGRYEEAEPLFEQALQIRQKVLGEQNLDTASSLNNLAVLHHTKGRYKKAERLYKQAFQIYQHVLGKQHPDTARSLNNLALLYKDQSRYKEAEPLLRQALQIRQEMLGAQHPATASSLNDLAVFYHIQGMYEEAEPLYKQALQIRQEVLGARHHSIASSLNNLASLYKHQGRCGEAELLYKQAFQIHRDVLGVQHPDTATSLNNLAELYDIQGRYEEAEPLYEQALAILLQTLGETHPTTQTVLDNYRLFLAEKEERQQQTGDAMGKDDPAR